MDYNELYFNKIYDNGTCPHLEECNPKKYKDGHSCYRAKIGKEYENCKTKIMFVGKEDINGCPFVESPQSICDTRNNNKHYLGLYYTAVMLLNGKEPSDLRKETLEKYTGLEEQYCLTNYFKCAFKENLKDVHGLEITPPMKKYCHEYLVKEIALLNPDIVIIQGKFTNDHFYKKLTTEVNKTTSLIKNENGIWLEKYEYTNKRKPLYIVWSYHPAGSKFYNNETMKSFQKALSMIPGTAFYNKGI